MNDIAKLKDTISEYDKACKEIDERLNRIAESIAQARREQAELSSRPD